MLEVNAIYFILLVEGFGLLLILILLWLLIAVIRLRRKRRSIRDYAARIKNRAAERSRQSEAFLQAVYHLEADELRAALEQIEKREGEFFQLLLLTLRQGKPTQIAALETAFDAMIAAYKCLQPRPAAETTPTTEVRQRIEALKNENDELRSELSVAKNGLSDMLTEFGNMFGGGKDHELNLHDLKQKLAALQVGSEVDVKLG